MKIVFLTADCSEQGTYFRWHNIAIGLTRLGHNVQVFCIDNANEPSFRQENRDGIEYHIFKSSKGKSLFGTVNQPLTAIRRVFEEFPSCDIVHVFQPFLTVYLPWRFNLKKKARFSFFDWDDLWADEVRDADQRDFRTNWDYKLKRYFEKKIPSAHTNMTVCSTFLKKLAHSRGANTADVIPNGFWPYQVPDKLVSRRKLGLKEDAVYFGFMGRTGFELHWCFEALEKCLDKGLNIRIALCGPPAGVLDTVPERVKHHIDYLGIFTPLETRDFAAAIDLGLLPLMKTDFNESRFPIKFAEYMAAGLPVLCSEIGEINEYGKNFPWVLKAGTSQSDWEAAFINAAGLMLGGNVARVDMQMISERLSWDKISEQVEKVYLHRINI